MGADYFFNPPDQVEKAEFFVAAYHYFDTVENERGMQTINKAYEVAKRKFKEYKEVK